MGRVMGLGELCEPMQTCNCSNPMKKRPLLLESFYGAGYVYLLQPLTGIILQELEKLPVEEMLCYA